MMRVGREESVIAGSKYAGSGPTHSAAEPDRQRGAGRFAKYYLSSPADARAPRAALLHTLSHAGLPPALVLTAELDVLRDEGEEYTRQLEAAGVRTKCVRYDGMIHEFFGLAGAVDGAKAALTEAANGLMEAFGTAA